METEEVRKNIRHLLSILLPMLICVAGTLIIIRTVPIVVVLIDIILIVIISGLLLKYIFC